KKVSDTTARARRDEWIEAGIFTAIVEEAITAYDKIIGLDLSDVAVDGANRNDSVLRAPTLDDVKANGLLGDIQTVWLDRGYDSTATRDRLEERGIHDAVIAKKRKRGDARGKQRQPMGLRWPVERTNSWLSNFGQLRRNTDRKTRHRLAQLALAVVFIITAKLIDWRNRWSPGCVPIR
ncbi:MAG: transposase, partial [Actinomycetota bacterium]|nr:transposase [Actinomycetota bacterium]